MKKISNHKTRGGRISAAVFIFGGALLAIAGLTGCQYVGFTSHTNPQISGRIVAADTHRPLAGVKIYRVMHGQVINPATPPTGGQLLMQDRPLTTDADGNFIYPSQSYMTLLREARWWSLKLSFQRAGYATWQTNFTLANVTTHLPDGTPVVEVGEIILNPLPK